MPRPETLLEVPQIRLLTSSEPYELGISTSGVTFYPPPYPAATGFYPIEGHMEYLKQNSCWLHDPFHLHTMYSSVLPSQQNSTLSQINTSGYSSHPGPMSVRPFKSPTVGSYYASPPKYDVGFRTAAPSEYYSTSRFEDPSSRFPPRSDSGRPSQYVPSIRTSSLTARDYPSRPPNQSNYLISRGNATDTYIYEQSDRYSQSDYDDTATNGSYSPISPPSPAMSTDSLLAVKSPLPSPLTERDSTTSTRRNSVSRQVVPPVIVGSTLVSSHATSASSTTPIPIPPSTTSTTATRPPSSTTSGSYSTSSLAPVPPVPLGPPNGGYTWHHAIPTIPPSEADTEDVSLEARMNAEYNAVSTGSLYTSPGDDNAGTNSGPNPVQSGRGRSSSLSTAPTASNGRSGGTHLHVTVPVTQAETSSDGTSIVRGPLPPGPMSPADSTVVESVEEGRGTGFLHNRNSTVVVGDEQFLPPLNDDRWVNDQERERQGTVSYQRITVPAPAPELRREYSSTRSIISSTNATYTTSPPRATVVLVGSNPEEQRTPTMPPLPPPTSNTRARRDSRASSSAPPPRSEMTRKSSNASSRSSPPRQEELKLGSSPRRRMENAPELHNTETTPPSTGAVTSGHTSIPGTRPDIALPIDSRSSEQYGIPSRVERKPSPPTVSSGGMTRTQSTAPADHYRPQSTAPDHSYRSTQSTTQHHRSQSNSPPERHRTPAHPSHDPYRTTTSDPYRSQSNAPYSASAPPPSTYRTTPTTSEPYRSQSTAPVDASYRGQTRQPQTSTIYAAVENYSPQTNTVPVPTSTYQADSRAPPVRTRTNSGSWSRNATVGSSSKSSSPPSRHAQPPVTRSNSRSNSPQAAVVDAPPPSRVPTVTDSRWEQDQRAPPPSYAASVSTTSPQFPSRDIKGPTKNRVGGDELNYTNDKVGAKGQSVLTVRNPSPSETSTERSSSPIRGVQQSRTTQNQPKHSHATTPAHAPPRRSTLPYDSRTSTDGKTGLNDYGRHNTTSRKPHEQPHRRLSDGDRDDRPSFSFNPPTGRNATPGRCVRWNENLICPSPVFPHRRKGWFNRRGDQLWTNEGAYRPPAGGHEYPPDLDEYPEYGQGWMNEEGVRIDMSHRLIPKTPLRSALKQPKPRS